jgi:hypothetical protein
VFASKTVKHATDAHYLAITTVGSSPPKPMAVNPKLIFVRKQTIFSHVKRDVPEAFDAPLRGVPVFRKHVSPLVGLTGGFRFRSPPSDVRPAARSTPYSETAPLARSATH